MDGLIDQAVKRCLTRFHFDPQHLNIRAGRNVDVIGLFWLSQCSFPSTQSELRRNLFETPNGHRNRSGGVLLKVLAEDPSGVAGYSIVELRPEEIYIFEMATFRPSPPGPFAKLGPVLLGVVACLAEQLGKREVTANVSDDGTPGGKRRQRLMLKHCARHGLKHNAKRGFLYNGNRLAANDTWISGSTQAILEILDHKFQQKG